MATSKSMGVMQARNDLPHIWRSGLMSTPVDDPLCEQGKYRIAGMATRQQLPQWEARKKLPNIWRSSMAATFMNAPLYCCYTVLCPNIAAYQLRGRALHGDWSRFTCCGGSMPCSGSCGEAECPRFCAAVEACCCFQFSVATTRFQLQDELRIQNTKCDNCIIGTMIWLQYLNCICSLVACLTDSPIIDEAAIITDRVADIAYCSVCACMQTQHKLEMDQRDGLLPPAPGTTIRAPPPPMEMSKH